MREYRKLLRLYLVLLLMAQSVWAMDNTAQADAISSYTAISLLGGFSVSYSSPLIFDKKASKNLSNFIAYQSILTNSRIRIGPILGDRGLEYDCKNPGFLQLENISDISVIGDKDIFYFDIDQFRGCIIKFAENQSALIVEIPKILSEKRRIKNIGITGESDDIRKLIFDISFSLSAEEIFVNILQITQAYSSSGNKIDWATIYNQGIEFIGVDITTCKGWVAANKYLNDELNNPDLNLHIAWSRDFCKQMI